MSYLEELLPEFRKGAKIRRKCWDSKRYIHLKGFECCDEADYPYDLNLSLIADDWEVVPDKPIDWDYIIKNKCLCWFWDGSGDYKDLGILIKVNENKTLCRYDCRKSNGNFYQYANCCPVRRDEVTFYEDKKR